jgi:hypothetical protein
MDASIERAQPRGVASSGVGADANNASNAAPTTRGSIPETSAVARETWLRSSTSRTALISSSVALAGGRSALDDRESNSESASARIGSGTSGGNAADRSDSSLLPNTECLYVSRNGEEKVPAVFQVQHQYPVDRHARFVVKVPSGRVSRSAADTERG